MNDQVMHIPAKVEKVRRGYRRISSEHLAYARSRFAQLGSTSAVRAELKARFGADYPHSALHYWWKKANPRPEPVAGDCIDVRGGDGC